MHGQELADEIAKRKGEKPSSGTRIKTNSDTT
jgi:hypothetical protein